MQILAVVHQTAGLHLKLQGIREMESNNIPRHIGIIMDGNRRFAKRLMLKPWKGHEYGAGKVQKVMEWCEEIGCHELTLYAFSVENFDRPKEEFDHLMKIFIKEFDNLLYDENSIVHKNKVRVNFIGRIWMFPDEVSDRMKRLMAMTAEYSDNIVNFAMAYGGRAEIIDATRKIAEQIKDGSLDVDSINEEVFMDNLYMPDEPDLVIRTSGEHRTSGFLIFQASYAELAFIDKMWPDLEKEDLLKAVSDYCSRDRRFGK
jgi:tritrans,polycis-undecaprenyl-diphosphate synthase [geranylgeranyl-diphosphate specific]